MKCTFENDDLRRYFYTVDEQGSTTLITSNTANICNEYYYDAFGNILESKEEVHNRITYTGQQYDQITNQYYLRARFYNPVVGRFTQEDIYRGDGLNLYGYCRSNPVMYYDPSGYVTYTNRDIVIDGRIIGTVNYKTGEYLKINIKRNYLNELNNEIGMKQVSNASMRKAFSLDPLERGKQIENIIANEVKSQYIQIGNGLNNKFPVIDLSNSESVVSIKSMNIYSNSYIDICSNVERVVNINKITDKCKEYYDAIDDIEISVNGNKVSKTLALEINKNPHAQSCINDINDIMNQHIENKKLNLGCKGKGNTLLSIG